MKLKNMINIIKIYLKQYGFIKTVKKIFKVLYNRVLGRNMHNSQNERYKMWIQNNEPTLEKIEKQKEETFKINPKFSIVIPMYNTPVIYFKELIESFIAQTYTNWELCLADGSSNQNKELEEFINKDDRIKYKFLNENKGIAGNTNAALEMATGDYIDA